MPLTSFATLNEHVFKRLDELGRREASGGFASVNDFHELFH
jgi:hypothetical protein